MIPLRLLAGVVACSLSLSAGNARAVVFDVKNLVSDGSVPARTTDPALKNPWGLAHGPTSPFWAADNGTGVSTLYNGAGDKLGLTVTIPATAGAPTGVVFNGTAASFKIGAAKPALAGKHKKRADAEVDPPRASPTRPSRGAAHARRRS